MLKVVFVGDCPSKTNVHPEVAFVGSRSMKKLVKWINVLSPDYYLCVNSNTESDIKKIESLYSNDKFKVVALGNNAAKRLKQKNVQHTVLPHPSGLNRKLNDKNVEDRELHKAFQYIRGEA